MDGKQESATSKRSQRRQQQQSHLLQLEEQPEKQQRDHNQQPADAQEEQSKQDVSLDNPECDQQSSPRLKSKKQLQQQEQQQEQKSKKYLTAAEKEYWQHKLPPGFQFYLERLARGVIRHQPENILQFCRVYLEELLVCRDAELWKLPSESYFVKLYRTRIGGLPWQPYRRHRSQEGPVLFPLCTETLPDVVATENLPESSLTSGEMADTAIFKEGGECSGESPDMITASECLDKQKEHSSTENQSSLEAGHHTTAPSASSDDSSTSFDIADDRNLPAADVSHSKKGTPVGESNLCSETVHVEHQVTYAATVEVHEEVTDGGKTVVIKETPAWGLNISPETFPGENLMSYSAAVEVQEEAAGRDKPTSFSLGNDTVNVLTVNGQRIREIAGKETKLELESQELNSHTGEEFISEHLRLHCNRDGGFIKEQLKLYYNIDDDLDNEQSGSSSCQDNVLGNEQAGLNSCRNDVLDNKQAGLNRYKDDVLGNEQRGLTRYRDDVLGNEQVGLTRYRDDVLGNEQRGLTRYRDDVLGNEQVGLTRYREDVLDNEQVGLTRYRDDVLGNEQVGLTRYREDVLGNEQRGLNSCSADVFDNKQVGLNRCRDGVLDNKQEMLNSGNDDILDNEQAGLGRCRDDVLDNEQPKLSSCTDEISLLHENARESESAADTLERERTDRHFREITTAEVSNRKITTDMYKGEFTPGEILASEFTVTESLDNKCILTKTLESKLVTAEIAGNENPFTEILGNENQFTEILGNESPFTEILGNENPFTEIAGNENPFTEILGNENTFTEILGNENPFTEILGNENPFTEILGNENPFTEIPGNENPFTEILGNENPFTEILGNENPFTEILGDEKPFTEILGNENPFTVIVGNENPFTEIFGNGNGKTEIFGNKNETTEIFDNEDATTQKIELLDNELTATEMPSNESVATEIHAIECVTIEIPGNEYTTKEILDREITAKGILGSELTSPEILNNEVIPDAILDRELTTTEILGKQLSTTEILGKQLSTTEIPGKQLSTTEILGKQLSTTEILGKQLSITEILGKQLSTIEILGKQLSTTEILGIELESTEIPKREMTTDILGRIHIVTEIFNKELTTREILGNELTTTEIFSGESTTMDTYKSGELATTEIFHQELTTREILNKELNKSEILNPELTATELITTEILNQEPNKTEIFNPKLTTTEILKLEPNTTEILSQELNTTEILSQELNTTEILSQELNTTEILSQELNTTEILSQEPNTTEILSQELNKTEIPSQELNTTEILSQEPNATEILSQELITTEILSQELNTTEILSQELNTTEILSQELNTTEILGKELTTDKQDVFNKVEVRTSCQGNMDSYLGNQRYGGEEDRHVGMKQKQDPVEVTLQRQQAHPVPTLGDVNSGNLQICAQQESNSRLRLYNSPHFMDLEIEAADCAEANGFDGAEDVERAEQTSQDDCLEDDQGKQSSYDEEFMVRDSSLTGLFGPAEVFPAVVDVSSMVGGEFGVQGDAGRCTSKELSPLASQTASCSCCLYTSEMRTNTPDDAGYVYVGRVDGGNAPTTVQGVSQNGQMAVVSISTEHRTSNVTAVDTPCSAHIDAEYEGYIVSVQNPEKLRSQKPDYEIEEDKPPEVTDDVDTGVTPLKTYLVEGDVIRDKEPKNVLSAHYDAGCVPVYVAAIGDGINITTSQSSAENKQDIEEDVKHELLIEVMQDPQDVSKTGAQAMPLPVSHNSSTASDPLTDNEDSDTCDPISDIQTDDRSQKGEQAVSLKKCRETSLRGDDVRSAGGTRTVRQRIPDCNEGEICQREEDDDDAGADVGLDEDARSEGQSLQLQPTNMSPVLSSDIIKERNHLSCGDEFLAEEKDSMKGVVQGNSELENGGIRDETEYGGFLDPVDKNYVQTCALSENWTHQNQGRKQTGEDKYGHTDDATESSVQKRSNFGEQHQQTIQEDGICPSDLPELLMELTVSGDIVEDHSFRDSQPQDISCMYTIERSPTFQDSESHHVACMYTTQENPRPTSHDSQPQHTDCLKTTQDNPTHRDSQPQHIRCAYTTQHSPTPTIQDSLPRHVDCMYTTQDSPPADTTQANVCPHDTILASQLEAGRREQGCYHQEGLGKLKVERALSLAKTYVSELERVAQNIEKILETHLAKTTQEPIVKENVGNLGKLCVKSDVEQHGKDYENAPDCDGTSVDAAPETRQSGFELRVSGSFLDEISHKLVDICEETASLGSCEKDSQAEGMEYRSGNVVVKIVRVQSCSFEGESHVDVGTNCDGIPSLSVSSAGDSAHNVATVVRDVHDGGSGEKEEQIIFENGTNTGLDSLSNHSNRGENNNNLDTNRSYNKRVEIVNVCDNTDIDNTNNNNYNNIVKCCSEYCYNKQINFNTHNIRTANSQHNWKYLNNRKNINDKKQQNTTAISKSWEKMVEENVEENIKSCCCHYKVSDDLDVVWRTRDKPIGKSDNSQFRAAQYSEATRVVSNGRFVSHTSSKIFHTAGETFHSINKLHNINNNGNIIGSEPRNFALTTESSSISTTKKEADVILRKKSVVPTAVGDQARVDVLVIDGNSVYPIPREAINGNQGSPGANIDSHLQAVSTETQKASEAVGQHQNRQNVSGQKAAMTSSHGRTTSASGNLSKPQNVALLRNQNTSKSRSKSAESVAKWLKPNEKQQSGEKFLGLQRTKTSLADLKRPKPVLLQGNVLEDTEQLVIDEIKVVSENKNVRSPRCYVQAKQRQQAEKQQNNVDKRLKPLGTATERQPLSCQRKNVGNRSSSRDKEVASGKPDQQSQKENMSDSQTTNGSSLELRRCQRIVLDNDTLEDSGEHVADAAANGGETEKTRSPKCCFPNKKYSFKRQENTKIESGLKKSGSVTCVSMCPKKREVESSTVADKENDDGVDDVKPHQQLENNKGSGLQKTNTIQSDLTPGKCTLPQKDTSDDANQQAGVANISGEKKRKGSPICYLQSKKKWQLEQIRNGKREAGLRCSVSPVCGKKPPCPSKQEVEDAPVQTEEMPIVIYVNSSSFGAGRFTPQETKNKTSLTAPSKPLLGKIPGRDLLDNSNKVSLNVSDQDEMSVPLPSRKDFPIRIRAVSKHDTSTEYLPTVTRRLTIESPAENLLLHSSYIRPNPRQPEHIRTFEVSSQRKRFYLGEGDEFINTEGTRRLICETECFSSKDPTTKHLVVENGTSSFMHATVKVVTSSARKRKKRFASLSVPRQVSQEPTITKDLGPGVVRDRSPVWQASDHFRKVGKYIVIGKTTNMGSIRKLLRSQEPKAISADTDRSTNAVHGTSAGQGECGVTPCKSPLSSRISGNGRGDNHIMNGSPRNIVDNNSNCYYISNYNKYNNCTNSNNIYVYKSYIVHGNYHRENPLSELAYTTHTNSCRRPSVRSSPVAITSTPSCSPTVVDTTCLRVFAKNFESINENHFFPVKTFDTDKYTTFLLVSDLVNNRQPSHPGDEYSLSQCSQDSNNNSKQRANCIDRSTSRDASRSQERQSPKGKAQSEAEGNDKVVTMLHSMECCICDDPRLSSSTQGGRVNLKTQVDARDISVTRETQTGESLNYVSRQLPRRYTKEIDSGRSFFHSNPGSCTQPHVEACHRQDMGTQVCTADICQDVEIQAGYPRDATGHLNHNINVAACVGESSRKKMSRTYQCGTQTNATDINRSIQVQTSLLLELNKPFQNQPMSDAETSHHCQKYMSDCETCYISISAELRDSQTQVTSSDIQSAVKTQTGESMMLTDKFPPPQLKNVADEVDDGDLEWGHLSVKDLPPEHQSVYAQTTQRAGMTSSIAGNSMATTMVSPGALRHQASPTN